MDCRSSTQKFVQELSHLCMTKWNEIVKEVSDSIRHYSEPKVYDDDDDDDDVMHNKSKMSQNGMRHFMQMCMRK